MIAYGTRPKEPKILAKRREIELLTLNGALQDNFGGAHAQIREEDYSNLGIKFLIRCVREQTDYVGAANLWKTLEKYEPIAISLDLSVNSYWVFKEKFDLDLLKYCMESQEKSHKSSSFGFLVLCKNGQVYWIIRPTEHDEALCVFSGIEDDPRRDIIGGKNVHALFQFVHPTIHEIRRTEN